jgi:purine nucleosidase
MVVTDLREHPFDAQYVHFAMQVRAEEAIRELMSAFWEEV